MEDCGGFGSGRGTRGVFGSLRYARPGLMAVKVQ